MRQIRMVGTCIVAAFAFGAVASASASAAEPAFFECHNEAKGHGKYAKGCEVEKEGGGYEIEEGIGNGKKFKGKGKGVNLELKGIGGYSCTGSVETGHLTSPTTLGDIVIELEGCEFDGKKCETGTVAGEIVTNPLKGVIEYLSGKGSKTPKVGVDLSAESGEVAMTFHCANDNWAVTGSIIGEVTPVNTFTKTDAWVFEQSGIGVQKWTEFEGSSEKHVLIGHLCQYEGCNPVTKPEVEEEMSVETTMSFKGEELMLKA